MTTEAQTQAGATVATVGRYGSKMASCSNGISTPIWTGKIYRAEVRQRDGVLTWRFVSYFGDTRATKAPSDKFVDELMAQAHEDGVEWMDDVKHGSPTL